MQGEVMSASKRALISIIMSSIVLSSQAKTVPLPPNFYHLSNGNTFSSCTVESDNPIFYIVVPESSTSPSSDKQKQSELVKFTQYTIVPKDFFTEGHPQAATKPIVLFFDWEEQENSKLRKQAGIELAQGINRIKKRFKKSGTILLGHGQGGNVINVASNHLEHPVDTVIELSVPVFPHTQERKKDLYADYLPNSKMIHKLFSFYSDQEHSTAHPSLHPSYESFPEESVHPQLKRTLLLINNKQPIPSETLRPLVGKRILPLCKKIETDYTLHNHFIAHLSTFKAETDMVVVLKDYRQNDKTTQEEVTLSKKRMADFTMAWGRPMAEKLTKGEKSRSAHKSIERLAKKI